MEYKGLNEIRESYLKFFESKGHLRLPSFSLIPQNDNSLLLINAGMAPLKPYFTGKEVPPSKRVTTSQKCIRTPDIERVGKTARHGTFFEMLGNFSFGDYFKHEAVAWAWEFVTKEMKMPMDKLWVTVYQDDDEAYEIWKNEVGVDPEKIVRMGKEDNFWEIGTGPCGPCSEIYFDRGEAAGCGKHDCKIGCDCDRFVEFWNLVFTQFDKDEKGNYNRLSKPNIDTGMGLERLAVIMQGVENIFEVDTIKKIREHVSKISGVEYKKDAKTDVSIRVITDHIRSTVFLILDGVSPSNEGRGYVLRRLLRRAARHGRLLGISDVFLHEIAGTVIGESKSGYPELAQKAEFIKSIVKTEEQSFGKTVDSGMVILNGYMNEMTDNKHKVLSGENAFKLHDTYGFPIDLTREILEENGLCVDEESFLCEMENQRQRAREARADIESIGWSEDVASLLSKDVPTQFVGYDEYEYDATIIDFIEGEALAVLLDKTPFYAESGGQVSDIGSIENDNLKLAVTEVRKTGDGRFIHMCKAQKGKPVKGEKVKALIDSRKRKSTARNHSATHLLHQALRNVLGEHVTQAGSLVDPNRARFDFNHVRAVSQEEILRIEEIVNSNILDAVLVRTTTMELSEAKEAGAKALFGEKYSDKVRVVTMGGFSMELCGGCHVKNTSEIGLFKIISESGVAAGVRRIEAITGAGLLQHFNVMEKTITMTAQVLKANPNDLYAKAKSVMDEYKVIQKMMEQAKERLAKGMVGNILAEKRIVNGIDVVTANVENLTVDELRAMGDKIKDKLVDGVVVLASEAQEKIGFICMVTKGGLKKGLHAGNIVKEVSKIAGGGGGGKPESAQAGGKLAGKIDDALAIVDDLVLKLTKG